MNFLYALHVKFVLKNYIYIKHGWAVISQSCEVMQLLIHALTHWPLGNLNEILGHVIFKQILVIDGWGISCEIAPIWMSLDFNDDQSTLVQVMAWCCQATSHYLSQCWPRPLTPYGVTRPQWVKLWLYLLAKEPSGLNQYIDGLVQDCSNSTANALELLQFCTKPSV